MAESGLPSSSRLRLEMTIAIRCSSERPRRSSLVMTSWSPSLATSRALSGSGRRAGLPLALSMRTWSQPAAAEGVSLGVGVLVDCRNPSVANPHWQAVAQTGVGVT